MNKHIFSFFFGMVFLSVTTSQAQDNQNWKAIFSRINEEVLTHSKAYSSLHDATATIGHRLTGSPNGQKAEQFAYDLLKSYGFSDVRFQPFEVESWSRKSIAVEIGGSKKHLVSVKSVSLAHSPVKADITAEIIDLGNGLESDYIADAGKVNNKIALVNLGILPGSPATAKNLHRSEKAALAIKYGAKGIIMVNTPDHGVLLTGTASVTGKLIPIPAICIGKEDGQDLKKALTTGKQYAHISMTNFSGKINARNVIATLPGKTIPDEKIVIGGHLDSWDLATGAIDNGIGSFAVLDMARTVKALNLEPKRTLEFVMFMGEEEGLLGSKAYIREAISNNSIDKVRFMLNYDMTNDPKGYAALTDDCKALFQSIGTLVQSIDTSFKNSFQSGADLHSDHQPFMLRGIPTGGAVGGSLPNNAGNCYHADCDDFSLVDEKGIQNTVRFNTMLLYGLADTDTIAAKRLDDAATKELLLKSNLKTPLQIAGEWRWKD
jgi:Iap family predicted aminopeptidase